jgi:ABC-type glutathione transport system ATPase component
MLAKRLENASLIFVSRNPAQLAKYCDQFWVLLAGQLKPCRSPEIGMKALNLLAERDSVTAPNFAKNGPEADANFNGEGLHDIRIW